MFTNWTDEQFIIWFAGFFDGEGCIYIPKTPGVEMSVANTEQEVIAAIHERLGLGIVTEVTFTSNNWKKKYHWRLRNFPEIHALLTRLRPFLTIKGSKADEALAKAGKYLTAKDAIAKRNVLIREMLKTHKQCDVARHFGLTRQTIADIGEFGRTYSIGPRRRPIIPETEMRHSTQTHHKDLVMVTTKSKLLS